MAHSYHTSIFVGRFLQKETLLQAGRNGLFAENVISLLNRLHRLGHMLFVLGRYHQDIGELRLSQQVFHRFKTIFRRYPILFPGRLPLSGNRVRHRHYLHLLRRYKLIMGIDIISPVAQSCNCRCYWSLHIDVLLNMSS